MITINRTQLLEVLANVRPTDFFSVTQLTNARVLKRACKAKGIDPETVQKLSIVSGQTGINYLNKKRKETNDSQAQLEKPSFYEFISENKVLAQGKKNPDQKYFVYCANDGARPITKYLVDGRLTDKGKIADIFSGSTSNSPVVWRAVKVENIRKLRVNKTEYKVV